MTIAAVSRRGDVRSGSPASPSPILLATPQQALGAFVTAVARRDREGAAVCFCREACFVTPDATTIRGREEIGRILAQLCALRIELGFEPLAAPLIGGDTALSYERWTVRSGRPGASTLVQTFSSHTVLRRVEGAWKLALAAPWGWHQ